LYFRRTLVIPDNLPAGPYDVQVLFGASGSASLKNLTASGLTEVNILNEEGCAEVLTLKNGLAARPMLQAQTWDNIRGLGCWENASSPCSLGTFSLKLR
jgi:hypothetical protein